MAKFRGKNIINKISYYFWICVIGTIQGLIFYLKCLSICLIYLWRYLNLTARLWELQFWESETPYPMLSQRFLWLKRYKKIINSGICWDGYHRIICGTTFWFTHWFWYRVVEIYNIARAKFVSNVQTPCRILIRYYGRFYILGESQRDCYICIL